MKLKIKKEVTVIREGECEGDAFALDKNWIDLGDSDVDDFHTLLPLEGDRFLHANYVQGYRHIHIGIHTYIPSAFEEHPEEVQAIPIQDALERIQDVLKHIQGEINGDLTPHLG